MIVAFDAFASCTSFSVMPPTPRCTMTSFTSSRSSLRSDSVHASSEPWTSAFNTMLSVAVSPRWICSKRSSRRAPLRRGHGLVSDEAGALGARFGERARVREVVRDAHLVTRERAAR